MKKLMVLGAASLGLIAITASVTIATNSHSSKHSSSMHHKHGMAHDEVNMPSKPQRLKQNGRIIR
jgi:maltose-binding protein MalE